MGKDLLQIVRVKSNRHDVDYIYWVCRKHFGFGWVREICFATANEAFDYVEENGRTIDVCS